MMGVKKITITMENGEDLIFEPKFPVSINIYKGMREKFSPYPIIEKEPNGREVILIVSGDDEIRTLIVDANKKMVDIFLNGG